MSNITKPQNWNVDPTFVAPEYQGFWEDCVFALPLLGDTQVYGYTKGIQGTLTNDALWVNGILGKGVACDGTDDHIECTVPPRPVTNNATMMVVAVSDLTTPEGHDGWMVTRQGGGNRGIDAYSSTSNAMTFSWDDETEEYNASTGINAYIVGVPYLMVCSIKPESVLLVRINLLTGEVEQYTDTNSNATQIIEGLWYIGGDPVDNNRSIDGTIYMSALHSRAMELPEIVQLSSDPFGPFRYEPVKARLQNEIYDTSTEVVYKFPEKSEPWNVDSAFVAPEYEVLWEDLKIALPFWNQGRQLYDAAAETSYQFPGGINNPTWGQGPTGSYLTFVGGGSDYVDIPNSDDINPRREDFSFAVLGRFENIADNNAVCGTRELGARSAGRGGWYLSTDTNARTDSPLELVFENEADTARKTYVYDEPVAGKWYLWVCSFDRGTNEPLLYQNGVLLTPTKEDDDDFIGKDVFDVDELRIGNRPNTSAREMDGDIAGLWVWKRALQPSEVATFTADPFGLFRYKERFYPSRDLFKSTGSVNKIPSKTEPWNLSSAYVAPEWEWFWQQSEIAVSLPGHPEDILQRVKPDQYKDIDQSLVGPMWSFDGTNGTEVFWDGAYNLGVDDVYTIWAVFQVDDLITDHGIIGTGIQGIGMRVNAVTGTIRIWHHTSDTEITTQSITAGEPWFVSIRFQQSSPSGWTADAYNYATSERWTHTANNMNGVATSTPIGFIVGEDRNGTSRLTGGVAVAGGFPNHLLDNQIEQLIHDPFGPFLYDRRQRVYPPRDLFKSTGSSGPPVIDAHIDASLVPDELQWAWRDLEFVFAGGVPVDIISGSVLLQEAEPTILATEVGGAFSFDQQAHYIENSANTMNLAATQPATWVMWFNMHENNGAAITKFDATGGNPFRGWLFGMGTSWASGALRIIFRGDSTSFILEVGADAAIGFDTWHKVVCTYDGSTDASGLRFFVDGAESSKTIVNDTFADVDTQTVVPITTAARWSSGSIQLQGAMDLNIAYGYTRELSAKEALALSKNPLLPFQYEREQRVYPPRDLFKSTTYNTTAGERTNRLLTQPELTTMAKNE